MVMVASAYSASENRMDKNKLSVEHIYNLDQTSEHRCDSRFPIPKGKLISSRK